jgi:hypothetical protein
MRRTAAWVMYWIGDLVSQTTMKLGFGYPLYNWLMTKSNDIQGEGAGPWRDPDDAE